LDRDIHVQLWDTAGQERYGNITKQYYQKADGVVVITSAENSLKENVKQFEKYLKMND
jgi:GTPase SAR1 family protein